MRDTIEMAREAGIQNCTCRRNFECLKAFEALVRADERDRAMRENAYVLAEREACAKVCERKAEVMAITGKSCDPDDLANAIRARSQA
jgi:hypothetical protein